MQAMAPLSGHIMQKAAVTVRTAAGQTIQVRPLTAHQLQKTVSAGAFPHFHVLQSARLTEISTRHVVTLCSISREVAGCKVLHLWPLMG